MGSLILLFLVAAFAAAAPPRVVDCTGTQRSVSTAQADTFRVAFADFAESSGRFLGREWLNFEALIAFGGNLVDTAELLHLLRVLGQQVAPANVTVPELWTAAQAAFLEAAKRHEGNYLRLASSHNLALLAKQEALQASALYAFVTRFADDHRSAVSVAAGLSSYRLLCAALASVCEPVMVGNGLFGLWCAQGELAVVVNTGFDGSLLTLWSESGQAAFAAGHSVLVLCGPGQGESALFSERLFTPDWAKEAVAPAVAFVRSRGKQRVTLWCRSFGGMLCAQAAAHLSDSLAAVVLDGGILDMYQNVLCSLDTATQQLYLTNRTAFDATMAFVTKRSPAISSTIGWAVLGLNVSSFGELLDAFQSYYLQPSEAASLSLVPVFVNNPSLDSATGHQSRLLWNAMSVPRHNQSVLFTPDAVSGVALHCGVGSTLNNNANILEWLTSVAS